MFVTIVRPVTRILKKASGLLLCGSISLAALASGCHADQAGPADYKGNMPEGIWVLNQERSKKFMPGTHTLWVIKDDGQRLVWVSVEADPEGHVRVTSWDGEYGGEPVEVKGSGMMTVVSSPEKGRVLNHGDIPGLGSYSEDCTVMNEGKRMLCTFTLTTSEGVNTYIDDFDWFSAGPMVFAAPE
ncbi:hypothetical protein [Kordiimonas pumila]|uniref:Lipoprotein n=1 Tax=Kordiimonas pumila TaxID=2161677 RepID=A0ABV7D8C7_9PROT|nr:hypothetical protein [Kordiimonas pumila]